MISNKETQIALFFLIGILISVSTIAAFTISNPQFTAPGANSFSHFSGQNVNPFPIFSGNQCQMGQDFIVQVSPFGCTPATVRSDLLEDQDVPVFCQLSAIKINPLINIQAISSISFGGDYPKEIAGVGFHPANAAVRSTSLNLLNSPSINNIGYAVVLLRQQPNESSMPDFVSGNLTATIKYDIQNAFGVGQATQYVPELSEQDWNENYAKNSFWNGKGFLRVQGIEDNAATVSIYSDKENRVSTFNIKKGETSSELYLPGFYCQAGLTLRLDDVSVPDTRVRLRINGEIVEAPEGAQILENQCSIRSITKRGFSEEVDIGCKTDNGFSRLVLKSSPTIKLKITDSEISEERDVRLGERLFTSSDGKKSVYLSYIGTRGGTTNLNDSFVYLLETPQNKENLSIDELESAKSLAESFTYTGVVSSGLSDLAINSIKPLFGAAAYASNFISGGKQPYRINYKEGNLINSGVSVSGKTVGIVGLSTLGDFPIKNSQAREYYQKSMEDYRQLISQFSNEKEGQDSQTTFGREALTKSMDLSFQTQQFQTLSKLCDEFKEKYPSNSGEVDVYCNTFKLSSMEQISSSVIINGQLKTISLEDVSEPTLDDFGARIIVRRPDGSRDAHELGKNEILPLSQSTDYIFSINSDEEITQSLNQRAIPPAKIYFLFNEKWKWSADKTNWADLTNIQISDGISKGFTLKNQKTVDLFNELRTKKYDEGTTILVKNQAAREVYGGNDFIQLVDLTENSARLKINLKGSNTFLSSQVIRRNVEEGIGGYVFTLTDVKLKRVAKVSILPNVKNAGTQANFSFTVGIEKRAIQLTPDQIRDRIESLNKSIKQWEETSSKVGEVVKGFNAACLAVGTTLTIKNLFENFDGKSIARQEVMRSSGGWMNVCQDKVNLKEFSTVEACLLENSDKIEKDVELVEKVMNEQQGITKDNVVKKVSEIRTKLGTEIKDPYDKEGKKGIKIEGNLASAFTDKGYAEGKISLSQLRDVERLKTIMDSSGESSPEIKSVAHKELYKILSNIQKNFENFALYSSLQDELKNSNFPLGVTSYAGTKAIPGTYSGGVLKGSQIFGVDKTDISDASSYPSEVVVYNNKKYLLVLKGSNYDYYIDKIYGYEKVSDEGVDASKASAEDERMIRGAFSKFVKYDSTTYRNRFKDPHARYFETEPYKGLPAIVPFDTNNGWYVATKQVVSGLGNIRAYDESGKLNSFYICNVGKNGREEFYSNLGDDACRSFNPAAGQLVGEFESLSPSETANLVSKASKAVQDASSQRQTNPSLTRVSISGQSIPVGSPTSGIPDVQCQDFMSPKDCLLLFNVCDPVICPSSRCNLGGAYSVPDVIQSGIIGSVALCLPNVRENIAVPICLSGVKAGIDGFVSVEKNYRDCLQTNLETGKTVGICDEIHSVYLCDFFWSQAQPMAKLILPKIFEAIAGQTGRGGGEYLGVASAWANAGKSIDYMTQYYGAASFEAFRTGVIKEVGNAVCRNFVSASYPSKMNFFDSLIEPQSPPQYTAWFSESPYTTATVPATSRYKIFYHIFAGNNQGQAGTNSGAFYSVYLKTPAAGSFYQYAPTVTVASGFIPPGEFATDTNDFTAPSGYKELCVRVNAQEECGFSRVTTDFGLDYVQDLYVKDQAGQTDIKSEADCVSGTSSLYSFANPNLQAGAREFIDPSLSNQNIVRVCATDNPGKGTDPLVNTQGSKWIQVGTCDEGKGTLKCYLDTKSVKDAVKFAGIENATLKDVTQNAVEQLKKEGEYININDQLSKISKFNDAQKVAYITPTLVSKAFLSAEKAKLVLIRATSYANLALESLRNLGKNQVSQGSGCFGTGECSDSYALKTTCAGTSDCQKLLGYKIAATAQSMKLRLGINDETVLKDTGAKNFECLVLQIAMQESSLQHCKNISDSSQNPLYCDGKKELVQGGPNGEQSFGVMQINIADNAHLAAKELALNFDKNVEYAIEQVLIKEYKTEYKTYNCLEYDDGSFVQYSGWQRALRTYNGWNTNCEKGDVNYVDNVLDRQNAVKNLFPDICGDEVSSGQDSGTNSETVSASWIKESDSVIKLEAPIIISFYASGANQYRYYDRAWWYQVNVKNTEICSDPRGCSPTIPLWVRVDREGKSEQEVRSAATYVFKDGNEEAALKLKGDNYENGVLTLLQFSRDNGFTMSLKNVGFSGKDDSFSITQNNKKILLISFVQDKREWWARTQEIAQLKSDSLNRLLKADDPLLKQNNLITPESQELLASLKGLNFGDGAKIILSSAK